MSQSGDNTVGIMEYVEICRKEYIQDKEKYNKEVCDMSDYMKDAYKLSENKNLLYRKRQGLINRKFEVADKIVYIGKSLAKHRKQKLSDYKVGSMSNSGPAVKPSNKEEREAFLEADLVGFEEAKKVLDNHMEYLEDSIKNVSDMIFGIPFVIQLEEFKQRLK